MRNNLCLLFLRGRKSHSFPSSELCLSWDNSHGPMQCHIMKNWDIKTGVNVNYSQFKVKWILKTRWIQIKMCLAKNSWRIWHFCVTFLQAYQVNMQYCDSLSVNTCARKKQTVFFDCLTLKMKALWSFKAWGTVCSIA